MLKYSLLDLAEHYNKIFTKSARNPPTSLLPAFLLPTSLLFISLLPTFKLFISLSPFTSKKFNYYCVSAFLKK